MNADGDCGIEVEALGRLARSVARLWNVGEERDGRLNLVV